MNRLAALFILVARSSPAQISNEPPPYCEPRKEQWTREYGPSLEEELKTNGLTDKALNLASAAWCEKPDDPERKALIAKVRQRMVAELGFSAEETAASLRLRQGDAFSKEMEHTCAELAEGAQEATKARIDAKVLGALIGCSEKAFDQSPAETSITEAQGRDLTDEIGVLWAAGRAVECFGTMSRIDSDPERQSSGALFARCHLLSGLVDRAAFDAALARDSRFTPNEKISAKENVAFTQAVDRAYVEFWKPRMAKNPVLREIFIDAPKQGYARWAAERQANNDTWAKLIAVETSLLAATGKVPDCGPSVRPLLAQLFKNDVVEIPAWPSLWAGQSLKRRVVAALHVCEEAAGTSDARNAFSLMMPYEPAENAFGPVGAAMRALRARFLIAFEERPKFDWAGGYGLMPPSDPSYDTNRPHYSAPNNALEAPIASVQRKGEKTVITFKQETWSEVTASCTSTNKILGIDPHTGDIRYERHCVAGPTVRHVNHEKPITVAKEYANGLKPGQLLVFVRPENETGLSIPTVSFANSKKTKVVTVLGQPTK